MHNKIAKLCKLKNPRESEEQPRKGRNLRQNLPKKVRKRFLKYIMLEVMQLSK